VEWSTSCPDWAARLKSGQTIIPPPIFPEEAERALVVFKQLRIVDAPGSPTFGEACAPWVFDLVASIFGAYDPDSGRRLITEWFILIPKKNSKSTIAAGIMMTALVLNWRESAEFNILAPTIEIANNSYSPARDMVRKDDELDLLMHEQSHVKTITHRVSKAILKVLAADSSTVGGKKAVGTLVDELWLLGMQSNAENMLREATGGLASRPEGFVIYLTTQSDDPPAGVFKEKLQYARDVRDGKIIDPRFVPVIFEFPEEMIASKAHLKTENFGIVNPNLNFSVDKEFIEREFKKAESNPASLANFLAKHLNVEIGLNLRSDRWPGAEFWPAQADGALTLSSLLARCEVVDIGIDGGGLDDLLGLAVIGRVKDSSEWVVWTHAWAHPSVLERRKSEAARFRDFEKDGDLTIVARIGDDVQQVADIVERVMDSDLLDKIGVDPVGIGAILDALEDRGVEKERVVGVSQGWRLGGAIKTTERRLAEGGMHHSGQPLMNWCVGNAKVEQRANSILITKQSSGTAKIDPLMAVFNAVDLISRNPPAMHKKFQMMILG
jgi:phage terminase large subunit-like protein